MVGLGGCSTGDGLFTLKPLHAEVWVCAYAPSAPFEVLTPGQVDEAVIISSRPHGEAKRLVWMDGSVPWAWAK